MTDKWQKFHSQYSSVAVGTVNLGASNIVEDLNRLNNKTVNNVVINTVVINDIPIERWKNTIHFTNVEEVESFFKEVILLDLNNDINKDAVVAYLLKSFHQGGFMCPVSAPMNHFLHERTRLQGKGGSRALRILTTENGFKVEEVYILEKLVKTPAGLDLELEQLFDAEEEEIGSDAEEDFVIKAGACIDVDFSLSTDNPQITVESNYISYGHRVIQARLDDRHLGQIIIDFFRNLFGLNSLIDIADNPNPQENAIDPDGRSFGCC